MCKASVVNARPPVFTKKPGASRTTTGVRPIRSPNLTNPSITQSSVEGPLITSTKRINGTGLKKCKPANLSCLSHDRPKELMGKDDVFEAIIHSELTCCSNSS